MNEGANMLPHNFLFGTGRNGRRPGGLVLAREITERRKETTDYTDITDGIFRVDEVDYFFLSVFIRVIRGQKTFFILLGLLCAVGG